MELYECRWQNPMAANETMMVEGWKKTRSKQHKKIDVLNFKWTSIQILIEKDEEKCRAINQSLDVLLMNRIGT